MSVIQEHDSVVLTDLPPEGLKVGDVGTVVHIHGKGGGVRIRICLT